MIILAQEDLHDQAGMERAFRKYFEDAREQFPGTFNVLLDTGFYACDYEKKTLTLSMALRPWMSNPGHILHGGVTASVLDMTMGLLCRYVSNGHMTPTVNMNVSYLRAVPMKGTVLVRAEVTRCGRTICSAVSSMYLAGEEERVLAAASGAYFVTGAQG